MTKENLVLGREKFEIQNGKVIIDSEELAAAIQECEVDLTAEESAEDFNICIIIK